MSPIEGVYILMMLSAMVLLSEWLQKVRIFRMFGAALLVIILTAIIANLGLIPTSGNPVYSAIFDYIAPASIFLLLLDVNLRELRKAGFPMLLMFGIGTVGTTVGVLVAKLLVHDNPLFGGAYHAIAGMIAGTYTGGSINFNAVALYYDVMENGLLFASTTAVDNIITAIWMFVTISAPVLLKRLQVSGKRKQTITETRDHSLFQLNILDTSILVFLTVFSLWASEVTANYFSARGIVVPSILIITTLALIFAQIPLVSRLSGGRLLGSWLVFLFLAVVGAYCDFAALREAGHLAGILFVFICIVVAVHGLFMFVGGKWIIRDWDIAAIASQANIGGSTTAMALAQNFGRHELVLPAIIVGSLGNAVGTYIGFLVASMN